MRLQLKAGVKVIVNGVEHTLADNVTITVTEPQAQPTPLAVLAKKALEVLQDDHIRGSHPQDGYDIILPEGLMDRLHDQEATGNWVEADVRALADMYDLK